VFIRKAIVPHDTTPVLFEMRLEEMEEHVYATARQRVQQAFSGRYTDEDFRWRGQCKLVTAEVPSPVGTVQSSSPAPCQLCSNPFVLIPFIPSSLVPHTTLCWTHITRASTACHASSWGHWRLCCCQHNIFVSACVQGILSRSTNQNLTPTARRCCPFACWQCAVG
jgi:hypothetical protein